MTKSKTSLGKTRNLLEFSLGKTHNIHITSLGKTHKRRITWILKEKLLVNLSCGKKI